MGRYCTKVEILRKVHKCWRNVRIYIMTTMYRCSLEIISVNKEWQRTR